MPYAAARRTLTSDRRERPSVAALHAAEPSSSGSRRMRRAKCWCGPWRRWAARRTRRSSLFLVGHGLVPANEWTSTFRRLQAAAESDPRIDHARAFEQHYRLAPAGAVEGVRCATARARATQAGPDQPLRCSVIPLPAPAGRDGPGAALWSLRGARPARRGRRARRSRARRTAGRALVSAAHGRVVRDPEAAVGPGTGRGRSLGEDEQLALLEASHQAECRGRRDPVRGSTRVSRRCATRRSVDVRSSTRQDATHCDAHCSTTRCAIRRRHYGWSTRPWRPAPRSAIPGACCGPRWR